MCVRSRDALINNSNSGCDYCYLRKNLIGVKRYMLTALYPNGNDKNGQTIWHCRCDCGKEVDYNTNEFATRKSCGCKGKSKGEIEIENILIANNIKYLYDKNYFDDLIFENGYKGRYDFILLNENNEPYRLIEFDGEQHFHQINLDWPYEKIKHYDEIKNEYAISHNLPLVRVPY